MNLSRREALAGLGATAAAGTGIGWLRVSDVRPYDPDTTVSADQPSNERVVEAANRLWTLDHRADITVEVRRDGSGETPYRAAHNRFFHQPSRRRTWFYYTTYRIPAGNPGPAVGTVQAASNHHYAMRAEGGPPVSLAVYLSDGFHALDQHAPVPNDPDDRPRLSESAMGTDQEKYLNFHGPSSVPPHIHEHQAEWTEVTRDEETVTFRITDLDAYAQVPPLPEVASLNEGCRIEVTFDRETGLLRRIVDERATTRLTNYNDDAATQEKRQYRYRIETEFSEYGKATAPLPENRIETGLNGRLRGTWLDLKRY